MNFLVKLVIFAQQDAIKVDQPQQRLVRVGQLQLHLTRLNQQLQRIQQVN